AHAAGRLNRRCSRPRLDLDPRAPGGRLGKRNPASIPGSGAEHGRDRLVPPPYLLPPWDHDRPRVRNGGKNPNPSARRLERFREPEPARVPARPAAAAASARSPLWSPLGRSDRHLRRHSALIATFVAKPDVSSPRWRQIATSGRPGLVSEGPPLGALTGRFGDSAARAGASRSSLPAPVLHDCRRLGNGLAGYRREKNDGPLLLRQH
ncbi:Meiotic coiled-coil protein 1, partial [Frankliniella fusca]